MVRIYKSFTDTCMLKLGLRPCARAISFSGNICFEFSVLCICSAGKKEEKLPSPYAISDFRLETLAMDFVYCTNSEVKRPIQRSSRLRKTMDLLV
jgi:hypothetical protein